MLKIAVVGKGGVGKTTIAACIARLLGKAGYRVLAIDADPSLNLAIAIGIPREITEKTPVLFDEEEFIKSRTLLPRGLYVMNPRVDDIVEKFGIQGPDNVTVIKLGEVKKAGSRCLCPEYAFLRALLSHLILGRREVVVLDMVAGLEHMSRGVVKGIDLMLCIVEPSLKAIDVAVKMYKLSMDLSIRRFEIIANKIKSSTDVEFIEKHVGLKVYHILPYDESVVEADFLGISVIDYKKNSLFLKAMSELVNKIMKQ
ncbi:MAG: AAA family ATPase [Desulfurococcaceae archaeon]